MMVSLARCDSTWWSFSFIDSFVFHLSASDSEDDDDDGGDGPPPDGSRIPAPSSVVVEEPPEAAGAVSTRQGKDRKRNPPRVPGTGKFADQGRGRTHRDDPETRARLRLQEKMIKQAAKAALAKPQDSVGERSSKTSDPKKKRKRPAPNSSTADGGGSLPDSNSYRAIPSDDPLFVTIEAPTPSPRRSSPPRRSRSKSKRKQPTEPEREQSAAPASVAENVESSPADVRPTKRSRRSPLPENFGTAEATPVPPSPSAMDVE